MVLFSRARGKLPLNTSRGGILLSLRALTGLLHFPVGMMRAEVALGCGKRPFIRCIQTFTEFRGRPMKNWSAIWLVVIAFVCFAPSVLAQSGSFAGSVTDSTGAEVPNAKITAVNVATGISRTAETDESGTYRITNLNPGVYDVRIEHPGFKSILFSQIPLSVDAVLTLDAHLVISSAKETVTVTSEAVAPVNINDAQMGNLVDSRQMTDLPLILRDPYALILLSPGVIQSNTLFGGFSVNGSRERSNNFLLDGTDNNDPDFGGFPRGLSALNPETTQEFRVINNSYLPEFGRNSGAIIDIVTKHGTNDFHADAYWFGRYTALSAKDYFAADRNDDPFVRNQFGFSLGGPIQKNRTFFFVNGELQRFSTTILNSSIVPTQAFKTGVFTYTLTDKRYPLTLVLRAPYTMARETMPPYSLLTPPCSKFWPFIRPPMGRSWTARAAYCTSPATPCQTATALPDASTTTSEAVAFSPCTTLTTSIRITTTAIRTFSPAWEAFPPISTTIISPLG